MRISHLFPILENPFLRGMFLPAFLTVLTAMDVEAVPPDKAPATMPMSSKSGKPAGADTLDMLRLRAEYAEANFDTVIHLLENFRAQHPRSRQVDSFYVAKYLGVVYTSNPNTREKGKYWLYRMLQIDPGAQLVDMYVGEEVDRTFEKVRQEFIVRRNYQGINDIKLNRAVQAGDRALQDTVVLRDTVRVGEGRAGKPRVDSAPEGRSLKELKYGWTGNVNVGVGMKFLDKAEWEGLEVAKQTEFRFAFDIRQKRWPINIAVDYTHSFSKESFYIATDSVTGEPVTTDYKGVTDEINVGVRKIFDRKMYSMRPFIGAGFGYMGSGFYRNGALTYQNFNTGVWAEGGVYWELEKHFNLGVEALWSSADVPLSDLTVNAGGNHILMLLGYHW